MKTFNILPKARWLVTITLLLSFCIPHAWAGVRSGWTRVTSVSEITSGGTFIVGFESTANSNTIVPMINKPSTLTAVDGSGTSYLYSGTASTSNNTTINMSDNGSGATTSYEFEFVTGSSSGTISIKLSDNTYVGFYGSSNNNCKRYSSVSTNSSFTPTITTNDVVTLTNVQYTGRKLRYNNSSGSYRFSNYSTAGNVVLYKKASSCDKSVGVTKGSESHGEVTTIGSASVATCSGTASDRRVTITVTPDDCYDAPSTLTWTKSSGTVSASKQSGPTDNGDGTYSYVYQFAQNDNGAGTFGVTCTAKAAGKTVNFDAGPGSCLTSSLPETCDGSGVTLPSVTASGVCKGWTTFAGWATAPVTDSTTTSVTVYAAGSNYVPASNNMTLYAVYSKVKGGGSSTLTIYPSTYTNKGTNNYGSGAERTGTVGTINLGAHYVTGNAANIPGGSTAGQFLQCQGNNANIYNKTTLPGKITQVVLNQNSATAFSLYCGTEQLMSSDNTSTGQTPSGTAQTAQSAATQMTWTVSGNYTYFDIKKGSSAGYITSIVITYGSSTTYYCSDPNCASCSADPSAGTASLNGSFTLNIPF